MSAKYQHTISCHGNHLEWAESLQAGIAYVGTTQTNKWLCGFYMFVHDCGVCIGLYTSVGFLFVYMYK